MPGDSFTWKNAAYRVLLAAGLLLSASGAAAQSNETIYADSLAAGWNDWSWDCTRDFNNPSPKYSGSKSLAVTYSAWGALALHHQDVPTTNFDFLEFHVHGGTNAGMDLQVYLSYSNTDFAALRLTNYLATSLLNELYAADQFGQACEAGALHLSRT